MRTIGLLLLCFAPYASAGFTSTVPEPGTLELLSIGIVAVVIAAIRSRRK